MYELNTNLYTLYKIKNIFFSIFQSRNILQKPMKADSLDNFRSHIICNTPEQYEQVKKDCKQYVSFFFLGIV